MADVPWVGMILSSRSGKLAAGTGALQGHAAARLVSAIDPVPCALRGVLVLPPDTLRGGMFILTCVPPLCTTRTNGTFDLLKTVEI